MSLVVPAQFPGIEQVLFKLIGANNERDITTGV